MGAILTFASFPFKASVLCSGCLFPAPSQQTRGQALKVVMGTRSGPLAEARLPGRLAGGGRAGRPKPGRRTPRPKAGTKPARSPRVAQATRACPRPDWPGSARAGPAGRARPRRRSAGLNVAGPMWAAGRWGAARPPSDAWFPADCSARSRPSSGSVSALTADARGQGLEAVRSPSPPLSYSNSTRSLLSPLCHQSFAFDDDGDAADEEEVDEDAHDSEAKGASLGGMELRGRAR